jgi:hypothetical protein
MLRLSVVASAAHARRLLLAAIPLAVMIAVVGVARASDFGCFVPADGSPFRAGERPAGIAVAELNRRGRESVEPRRDLAVSDAALGRVLVFLGRGDATFRRPVAYDAGRGARAIVASDLDGDGDKDLAVANSRGSTVSVLIGRGDGSFRPQQRYRVGEAHSAPSDLAVRDLDRDGDRDLAVTLGAQPAVALLLGRGDGTFRRQRQVAVTAPAAALVARRFDAGRSADLAVAHGAANKLSILFGRGNGTLRRHQEVLRAGEPGGEAVDLVAGDFGRPDGDLDLAIATGSGGGVAVRLGYGDGGFRSPRSYPTAATADSLAIGELTGEEGRRRGIDLAVVSAADDLVTVLRGWRDQTFSKRAELAVGAEPRAITSADLRANNALGIDDLAVPTAGDGHVSVFVNESLDAPCPDSQSATA